MFEVDREKCTGCAACADVCPQRAIDIVGGKAQIDKQLCIECSSCSMACPEGAVHETAQVSIIAGTVNKSSFNPEGKGVMKMPRGFGFGRGIRAGRGFRGGSPPWPYIGRGRGGLPRCAYPGAFEAPPHYYVGAWSPPYFGWQPGYGAAQYAPPVNREQELEFLREEANSIKAHLDGIEARIEELTGEKE